MVSKYDPANLIPGTYDYTEDLKEKKNKEASKS